MCTCSLLAHTGKVKHFHHAYLSQRLPGHVYILSSVYNATQAVGGIVRTEGRALTDDLQYISHCKRLTILTTLLFLKDTLICMTSGFNSSEKRFGSYPRSIYKFPSKAEKNLTVTEG